MSAAGNLYLVSLLLLTGTILWFSVGIHSYYGQSCMALDEECLQIAHKNRETYTAAVVEYEPVPLEGQSPIETLQRNVEAYIKLMEEASQDNVDIIVFPEYGITTVALPPQPEKVREYLVSVPPTGTNPCNINNFHAPNNQSSQIMHLLSCAAKRYNMYLVVNLGEIQECDDKSKNQCTRDGAFHYNTNVAFDRNGTIIARYRKFHLYFEPQFDYPQLEYSTFETDFGVEFGMFTCFDIIFANPAVEMIAKKGIRNFVFPTAWVDELPFLTAIQAQSLWAQSNQANLLAAGYHHPERGSMGSGIYSGYYHGALNYVFDPDSGTQLVISSVPLSPEKVDQKEWKKPNKKNHSVKKHPHFWLREDLTNCSYKTVDFSNNEESVCYEEKVCCDLEYDIAFTPETVGEFKLIAFDGRRTVAAKTDWFEWQLCAVVYCFNETLESCTENMDASLLETSHPRIQYLSIRMQPLKLEYEGESIAQPGLSLLDTSFNLIPQSHFQIQQEKNQENDLSVHATTKSSSNIAELNVKTIGLIQKIFNGRL